MRRAFKERFDWKVSPGNFIGHAERYFRSASRSRVRTWRESRPGPANVILAYPRISLHTVVLTRMEVCIFYRARS